MAVEAAFVRGESVFMKNHVAGANIAAGEVVPQTLGIAIAHRPILNGALGALAMEDGEYESLADAAIAVGADVWWNNTTNRITTTAAGNKFAGKVTSASTGADTLCRFWHQQPSPAA